MNPFNYEEAKSGKPVCTRDGRNARIICWDRKGEYPIIALIDNVDNDGETTYCFCNNGAYYQTGQECKADLFMKEESMYRPFKTLQEVMAAIKKHGDWLKYTNSLGKITCTKIISVYEYNDTVNIQLYGDVYRTEKCFEDYFFEDNTPFGAVVD